MIPFSLIYRFNSGNNSSRVYIPKSTFFGLGCQSFFVFGYNLGDTGIEYNIENFILQMNYDYTKVNLYYHYEPKYQYYAAFEGENLIIDNELVTEDIPIRYLYICMIPIFISDIKNKR